MWQQSMQLYDFNITALCVCIINVTSCSYPGLYSNTNSTKLQAFHPASTTSHLQSFSQEQLAIQRLSTAILGTTNYMTQFLQLSLHT